MELLVLLSLFIALEREFACAFDKGGFCGNTEKSRAWRRKCLVFHLEEDALPLGRLYKHEMCSLIKEEEWWNRERIGLAPYKTRSSWGSGAPSWFNVIEYRFTVLRNDGLLVGQPTTGMCLTYDGFQRLLTDCKFIKQGDRSKRGVIAYKPKMLEECRRIHVDYGSFRIRNERYKSEGVG